MLNVASAPAPPTSTAPQQRPQFSFPSTGEHVPEDKDQLLVQTPYGRGLVIRTRPPHVSTGHLSLREVQLLDWQRHHTTTTTTTDPTHVTATTSSSSSDGPLRPPMLYSTVEFNSVPPQVGDEVLTLYGRGRVLDIRSDENNNNNNNLVVLISSWRLAGRSRVTCYLSPSSVQVVRKKKLYEMSTYERVEHAQTLKTTAAQQFRAKKYEAALETYAYAVDAVRYVQHRPESSSNEVRADLLVVMITCCNNAGTCCTKLQKWEEAFRFAKNAVVLLDALEPKRGKKIHQILNRDGISDVKLFGEWRVKSNLIMARALYEQNESIQAMEVLKQAHDVIVKFTQDENFSQQPEFKASIKQLLANDKEVKKLHALCKTQKKTQREKEKQRARAMFATTDIITDQEEKKDAFLDTKQDKSISVKKSESDNNNNNSSSSKLEHGAIKKKVSCSEEVSARERERAPTKVRIEELEWYEDIEVLTGLAIFAGTVAATVAGLSYFLFRKR